MTIAYKITTDDNGKSMVEIENMPSLDKPIYFDDLHAIVDGLKSVAYQDPVFQAMDGNDLLWQQEEDELLEHGGMK